MIPRFSIQGKGSRSRFLRCGFDYDDQEVVSFGWTPQNRVNTEILEYPPARPELSVSPLRLQSPDRGPGTPG
jgi:hypothetical protein